MSMVLRGIQAGLLVITGMYMSAFALSDVYWQLLNPKYSWLTFVAGLVLLLVGAAGFLNRERRPRLDEILAIVVFLCLALVAALGPNPFVDGLSGQRPSPEIGENNGRFVGGSLTLHFDDEAVPQSETMFEGKAYTRMNLAELLAGEEGGWVEAGGRYAVQGVIFRTPEMDAEGYIGLGRLYVYCCLADAVGMAALFRVDRPEDYRAGAWARALGVLREGAPFPELTVRMAGALSMVRSERYVLQAVRAEEAQLTGIPFILDIKEKAPFDY